MPSLGLPRGQPSWLAYVASLVLVLALTLAVVPACGTRVPPEPRERALLVEGQVRQLVGREGFRVGAPHGADRGVLVLAFDRPRPRRSDSVRVVGLQHTLRVPELERTLHVDLEAYSRFEGEEILVAEVVEITRRGPQP